MEVGVNEAVCVGRVVVGTGVAVDVAVAVAVAVAGGWPNTSLAWGKLTVTPQARVARMKGINHKSEMGLRCIFRKPISWLSPRFN